MSQGLRNRRLMALRQGRVQILVATDVAARGIDVPSITHVFNFGLPMKAEDYTHRIGRTGRAGRNGLAVTLAEFRDKRKIYDIEAFTHHPLKAEVIAGLEPTQRQDREKAKPHRHHKPSGKVMTHRKSFESRGPRAVGAGAGAGGGKSSYAHKRPKQR